MDPIVNPLPLVVGNIVSIMIVVTVCVLGLRRGGRTSGAWRLYSTPLYAATATLATLTFVLVLSQGFALLERPYSFGSILTRFIESILGTLQIMSLDGPSLIGTENLLPLGWHPFLAWTYLVYQSLLFVLAPATAFSSLTFLFFTLLSSPALRWRSRKSDTYVFSEANSAALTLAQSILAHAESKERGKPVIAFAEVNHAEEAIVDEARSLGAICSYRSIAELASGCSAKTKRFFIFSSSNEAQNLRDALRLTRAFVDTRDETDLQPTVIVFSNSALSDGYADSAVSMCSGSVQFRRFDHTQNTINQVLMEMPVFLNVAPQAADSERAREALYAIGPRRVLILGAGNMGTAFLKGAIWSGQSNVSRMHIDVIDIDAEEARRRLALECPEIYGMLGACDPATSHDEAYDVEFHACNVFSSEFEELMRDHGDEVTYAFIALGDDLLTARAARRLRELLERSRLTSGKTMVAPPPIVTVVDDSLVSSSVEDAASPKGQPYLITTVGSTESLFSYDNVFHPKLERWASNLNATYWGFFDETSESKRAETRRGADTAYNAIEYNRISSRASAIFLKVHLFEFCRAVHNGTSPAAEMVRGLALPSVSDWTLPLDSPAFSATLKAYDAFVNSSRTRRDALQELEHRRWNAFMRTIGYERCDEGALRAINEAIPKGQRRQNCDHLSKLHICLVPFDQLEQVDEMFTRISGKDPHYKLADDVIIRHLRDIVLFRSQGL